MSIVKNKPALTAILAAVAIVAMALVACGDGAPILGGPGGASGGGEPTYFDIEVSISHLPKLNEPFTVTAKLTPIDEDETDAELWLNVTGAVYLDGEDRWHGPLKLGEEKTISATFAVVTEGNHTASAVANSTDLFALQAAVPPVWFHTTAGGSEPGRVSGRAHLAVPGEVAAGRVDIVETSLLLNASESPRIEFIQSKDDVARLQADGMFPQELRYRWRGLDRFDFSEAFLIAYFDGQRPAPGRLPVFQGAYFIWEDGVLKGEYKTFSLPAQPGTLGEPVSSVVMRAIGRGIQPRSINLTPYEGPRDFDFTVDGGPSMSIRVDFAQVPLSQ